MLLLLSGCASVAPARPRFVAIFEQRTDFCRIQVTQDTRSAACFVVFNCGRQPITVLQVDEDVCVP